MSPLVMLFAAFAVVYLASQALGAVIGGGSDSVDDLGGQVDTSQSSVTVRIAQAIAQAEGFFAPVKNGVTPRPRRNHNPGDMTQDLIGRAVGRDGAFVVYASDADGWQNLYAQVNAWLEGTSRHAGPDSTIADIASFYTSTDQQAWAGTVAAVLGVSQDTSIGQLA